MPPKRAQSGAGGTASKYKVVPESTEQPPSQQASSRPRSSRNQVAPEASRPASSQQASSRPSSPSGIELLPRTSSGRRIAWSARSASSTRLAPPEVQEALQTFEARLSSLHPYIQEKIASGTPASSWALFQGMLPKGVVVNKPEVEQFASMVQALLRPQKKHERDMLYARIQRFGTKHGLDTKKSRVDALRSLMNRRDDRVQYLQKLHLTQIQDLDEEDQEYYDDIDEYIADKSKTSLKSLPWILKILDNPALAVMAKEPIQAEMADLYAYTTKTYQGDYYRRYDLQEWTNLAFKLNAMIEKVKKHTPLRATEQAYLALLEDLQRDLSARLDAAWGLLVAFFEAPGTHPNPRARTHWIKETLLASFSNYMGLTEAHQATFQSFMETYFLHSPTTMPRVYRAVIHLYNKTYHAPLRDVAFSVLERMVALAETKLPKTSVHLRVFTIIQPFHGFFDEYYGTKYEDGDRHGTHYTRNFKEILDLLTASLLLEKRETQASQLATKKAFLKKKLAWFNKHYKAYLSIPPRD